MDHGINTERLGDDIEGSIAEYWELLFDLETGYWKEEIQDEYEVSGSDLLIIDCMEIRPGWRGRTWPGCRRQDYRHLWSWLRARSVQTLAFAIYSCLRL